MSDLPSGVKRIDAQAGSKTVLLLEGNDDKLVVEQWLHTKTGGCCQKVFVAACDGAARVRSALKHRQEWWGLCDSDDWTDDEKMQAQTDCPRLRFLPRYCLESFFIVPDELWELLPPPQQGKYTGGKDALKQDITTATDPFVRHWCMWVVLQRRRRQLLDGFPRALLDRVLAEEDLSEKDIGKQLKQWHDFLRPNEIYTEYAGLLAKTKQHKTTAKLKHYIHGKEFFRRIVCGKVLQRLDQRDHSEWLGELTAGIKTVPPELDSILGEFVA